MHVLALGPDMNALVTSYGNLGFWIIVAIIFAECGILLGFFLPGDSLLFLVGAAIAGGQIGINIGLACVVLLIAAILGNIVGYWVGYKSGPALFKNEDSKVFRKSYIDKTHEFFEKYGPRAIVLARFVPIVRTFITAIAGVGKMDFRKYITYTAIGGVLWAVGVTLLGYFFGQIPFIKKNIEIVLIVIVIISIIPMVFEFIQARRMKHKSESGKP